MKFHSSAAVVVLVSFISAAPVTFAANTNGIINGGHDLLENESFGETSNVEIEKRKLGKSSKSAKAKKSGKKKKKKQGKKAKKDAEEIATKTTEKMVDLAGRSNTHIEDVDKNEVEPTTVAPTEAPISNGGRLIPTQTEQDTDSPTVAKTNSPTMKPSAAPVTSSPTKNPSAAPVTSNPTMKPTSAPVTSSPTRDPSAAPVTSSPTMKPSAAPVTSSPTMKPSAAPVTSSPTMKPTSAPITSSPTRDPSAAPVTSSPTMKPSAAPVTSSPTRDPSAAPVTSSPTMKPTSAPVTSSPTMKPSAAPVTSSPTKDPSAAPVTSSPTEAHSLKPTSQPSKGPSAAPVTSSPTMKTTSAPVTSSPTMKPSAAPVTSSPTKSPILSPVTVTVKTSDVCEDSSSTFRVPEVKNKEMDCSWAQTQTKKKCNYKSVAENCPVTCKTCPSAVADNCEVKVSLVFEDYVTNMTEDAIHNDQLEVWKVNDSQGCGFYYNADYCKHDKKDGAFYNMDDDYYDLSESVFIFDAAGETYNIYVNHTFTYYEAITADADHEMAGEVQVFINGEQVEETWSHDVDQNTHDDWYYYENPKYDDSLVVSMTCDNACQCSFEKID